MSDEENNAKPVNVSNELAMTRTTLALDRTMLAWIRTSLALLGFGFTFAKYIHSIIQHSALKELNIGSPRTLGIFLMSLGVLGIAGGIIQYFNAHRHLKSIAPESARNLWSPTILMAILLLVASSSLTVAIMLKVRLW